jgi:transcriptional regulator with XRE-family HTH domain
MENTEGLNTIGDAIKELRKALGNISQERLARVLGSTTRTVARWEASDSLSPSALSQLKSIAQKANAWGPADFFSQKLHEVLDWEEDDFDLDTSSVPGNEAEREIVQSVLKRYRADDPRLQPILEQLRQWDVEEEIQQDREIEKIQKRAKPKARARILAMLEARMAEETEQERNWHKAIRQAFEETDIQIDLDKASGMPEGEADAKRGERYQIQLREINQQMAAEAIDKMTDEQRRSIEILRTEARNREALAIADANRQCVVDEVNGMEQWEREKKRDAAVADARNRLQARLREIDQRVALGKEPRKR